MHLDNAITRCGTHPVLLVDTGEINAAMLPHVGSTPVLRNEEAAAHYDDRAVVQWMGHRVSVDGRWYGITSCLDVREYVNMRGANLCIMFVCMSMCYPHRCCCAPPPTARIPTWRRTIDCGKDRYARMGTPDGAFCL